MAITFSTCGSCGGVGGAPFTDGQTGGRSIAEVRIRSGAFIDAIQIVYVDDATGETITNPRHGGSGGKLDVFKLAPKEYITEVGGKHGWYIDSLWIKTNKGRTSKKYGGAGGAVTFTLQAPPGTRIHGFFGRAGNYLDAIGVIMRTP